MVFRDSVVDHVVFCRRGCESILLDSDCGFSWELSSRGQRRRVDFPAANHGVAFFNTLLPSAKEDGGLCKIVAFCGDFCEFGDLSDPPGDLWDQHHGGVKPAGDHFDGHDQAARRFFHQTGRADDGSMVFCSVCLVKYRDFPRHAAD